MKFSKEYTKLQYPIFTTIRQNKGYYKEGQIINIITPKQYFMAEVVSIRIFQIGEITKTIALRDADCSKEEFYELMHRFYKNNIRELILITLMRV